ncbi:unnamed protein product [Ectocarpus sp. 8 AP-2014]
MILIDHESCAETVGGIIPKEMPSVANDWVKSRSLRVSSLRGLMYSLVSLKFG